MDDWSNLSIAEKAKYIQLLVANGITNLGTINDVMNDYFTRQIVDDVNNRSNADFINRLKDPSRKTIQDWEDPSKVATHKMGYDRLGKDDPLEVVYPYVQNINGQLHDFTDPKYGHSQWDALDSAIERGDTLMMTPRDAKLFIKGYKSYYPTFNRYDKGGNKNNYEESGVLDFIKSLGRIPLGTRKYTKDIPFKVAFREARDSGLETFIWNEGRYNTEIRPDEFMKEIKSEVPTTLREVASRKIMIRNPDDYRHLSIEDRNKKLSEEEFLKIIPYHKNINYEEINSAIRALYNEGLTKSQIKGMLGNSLAESGWKNRKQVNGPAAGYYQMESSERKQYLDWLKANKLKESLQNESVYIARLFKNKSPRLFTPYSGAVSASGTENLDYSKFRTAGKPEYKGITTEDAFKSWEDNTIDGATAGFMQLFERAGTPHLERRKFIANILEDDPNIQF